MKRPFGFIYSKKRRLSSFDFCDLQGAEIIIPWAHPYTLLTYIHTHTIYSYKLEAKLSITT